MKYLAIIRDTLIGFLVLGTMMSGIMGLLYILSKVVSQGLINGIIVLIFVVMAVSLIKACYDTGRDIMRKK